MVKLLDALKDVSLTSLDISSTGCGFSTASKLAELLSGATKFGAAVEALAIGANPIGTEGGNILIEAIQSSNLKTIDIGKPLPLQGKYESDTADLADSGMGPGQAVILAWWLTTDAAAALTNTCLLHNPLGEGVNEIIKVFEETPRLRTLCGFEEGVEQIDWKDSGKGPADVALLSAELRVGRAVAVARIDASGDFTRHLASPVETHTLLLHAYS